MLLRLFLYDIRKNYFIHKNSILFMRLVSD